MATAPRGMTITEAYRSFRENLFIVDRTYQRKLVWTLDEKKRLVDSILNSYPVPLILLVQTQDDKYEIIDGMQRLNAIFSFIENEYTTKDEKYFDTNEFATAKDYSEKGKFETVSIGQKLSRSECATILDYQLAVTIFTVKESEQITDIFGRINSGGKQLSPQEQRQAGVVSNFASFVRKLSSELRGDSSSEIVNLCDMPMVSIDAPIQKLGYGVKSEETFWCKQGVLRTKELRDSYDEQIVADLIASILLDEPLAVSKEKLDEIYQPGSNLEIDLNNRLGAYPELQLYEEIKSTFSALIETIETLDNSTNAFRKIVNPNSRGNPVRTPFYAVFMAFFDLIVRHKKQPTDSKAIMQSLERLSDKLETQSHHVKTQDRVNNIRITTGLIQTFFVHKDPPLLSHGAGLALDFENSLRRSKIETPRYEFKQGLLSLAENREKNENLIQRLAEVMCSMANIGPTSTGYIYIGVADSESDANRINLMDGTVYRTVDDKYVVGICREAKIQGKSIEDYVRLIISELRQTDLSEPLKTSILSNVDTIIYRGLSVIRFTVPPQNQMSWIGDDTYIREESESIQAKGRKIAAIAERFK